MRTETTAPSKLVWTGEYAVLEGAPAIVAALDRRVRASVEDVLRPSGWRLRSDLSDSIRTLVPDATGRMRLEDGTPAVEDPASRLPAVVLEDFAARTDVPPLDIALESRALLAEDGKTKLGLGSSAALVVALHGALARHLERHGCATATDGAPRLAEALRIHRALQAGRGSGIDVAASHDGGLLRFVRTNDTDVSSQPVQPPEGLRFRVLWTGETATTTSFIQRLEAARSARKHDVEHAMSELRDLAESAAKACQDARIERFLALVDAYREGLDALGRAIGADILTARHRELAVLAASFGAVYKPSGAGGGDVGVLFAGDRASLEAAAEAAVSRGFAAVPTALAPQGVTFRDE